MKQITTFAASLATLVALAVPALAVGSPDETFFIKAAQGGMAEVKLGQVAVLNGAADGKQFGAQMVKDLSKANNELMALAKQLGVKLPKAPNPAQQATLKKMQGLKGAAFDSAYLAAMMKDHKDTIALFEAEAAHGKAAQAKAWAAKTLPTLKMHLAMDQALLAKRPMGSGTM